MNEFWLILGMTAVTFGVRYPTMALVGRLNLSPAVIRALRFVPVAVLSAITVPIMVYQDEAISLSYTNTYLIAGLVSVVVSYYTKNLLLTIVIGLVVFFGYRALLGV